MNVPVKSTEEIAINNNTPIYQTTRKTSQETNDTSFHTTILMSQVSQSSNMFSGYAQGQGLRTRKHLHEKNVVLCKKQGEILYLEDYERVSGEVNEKSRMINEEALVLGCRKKHQKSKFTQKEACNEQVFTNKNVNDSRQTSTPNKLKGFKECYIDLSPISKDVLSNLIHYGD